MTVAAAKQRLLELLRELSFERKRVVLASGRESDFFIDCKQTALTAEGHVLLGELMFDALGGIAGVEAVAGVELGGCPLASAVSLTSFQKGRPLPCLYVRKAQKDHGSKRMIEGDKSMRAGMRVAILEDVVTTGGSTLKCADTIKTAGWKVVGVIAIIDRLEGGREAIEAAGLPLLSLYTRLDFMPD
jgi:orotate phosphoribosyltransferase